MKPQKKSMEDPTRFINCKKSIKAKSVNLLGVFKNENRRLDALHN